MSDKMDELKERSEETTEETTTAKAAEVTTEDSAVSEKKSATKRVFIGFVHSNKPDKTITVAVERQIAHPLYKKYYKDTRKFMAHDPKNECNEGDTVKIIESRARSARKRWDLVEIIERAK